MSPEFELSLLSVANRPDHSIRYKVELIYGDKEELRSGIFALNFKAWKESRWESLDFSLQAQHECISLSGLWRNELLSLVYTLDTSCWINEEGERISRPYPDGALFELMAAGFYPVVERYLGR